MKKDIFLSIKPKYVNLIINKTKNHEFRKYKPKQKINKIWIYTTKPVGILKYVIKVEAPIEYPEKIPENGIGNKDFNNGLKKTKFAIPIIKIYEIKKELSLIKLKKFKFTAPQSYSYIDNFPKLKKHLKKIKLKQV